jgi:hypothetical protein
MQSGRAIGKRLSSQPSGGWTEEDVEKVAKLLEYDGCTTCKNHEKDWKALSKDTKERRRVFARCILSHLSPPAQAQPCQSDTCKKTSELPAFADVRLMFV